LRPCVRGGAAPPLDAHPAVAVDLRVRHVVALVAHALGHGHHLVLALGLLLGGQLLGLGHGVLDDRLAGLVGRLELLGRPGATRLTLGHHLGDTAVALELGVGHVDAVVPHALGVLEHGVLELLGAGPAAAAPVVGFLIGGRRGRAVIDARHVAVVVAAAAASRSRSREGQDGDRDGQASRQGDHGRTVPHGPCGTAESA
jgi:hypothetical protein